MNEEKFAWRYLLTQCCLFALVIVFLSSCTGVLKAYDPSVSVQAFPSTSVTGTDLTAKCLECHKYAENHHPFGFVPSQPKNYPFPLYNGKITCMTCHIEDHLGGVNLLRDGPYADRRELCFKCHAETNYAKIDPHIMLDGRGHVPSAYGQSVCLFCHAVKPDPATDRTGDVSFKADIAFLCWRCHPPMANHVIFDQHFLVTPSMEMRRFMEKQEQQLQVSIPLVPRDRITCSTCHNPHQKGVIPSGPAASGADAPHRLRLPPDKICSACHNIM
jgi:hypothetical protein